ncbi:MAG TPA: DUF2207 domain-containing protein [Rhizomicrobium sp.]|jgi:uncharacterized membrane protein YgcG
MSRVAALIVALLAGLTTFARAEERITDFASDIRVTQTGALTVTESISVNSEGASIRHGIFRDFPTIYIRQGHRIHVGFDVLSVKLDGQDEIYSVERIQNGERVKIGDPKMEIPPGAHRFVLTYATDRQIGFYPGFDEIYWNVTGNFWNFPIDHAEAIVELPGNARILQYSAYTGPLGSTEQNAQSKKLSESAMRFTANAPLGVREGLTVAIGFSKGAVLPPSPEELRRDFIRDNEATIVACTGVILMLIYFIVIWIEHGQRPARGTVIPLFAPPKDFSPAAVRYVRHMGYDRKAYAAALIDMAVKGYLKITEDHGAYTLTQTGKGETDSGLAHGESAIASRLFAEGGTIELKQINHSRIALSVSALQNSLKNEYERVYFVTNSHWFIGGLSMLIVTGIATALLCDDPQAGAALAWVGGLCFGLSLLAHRVWDAWSTALSGVGSSFANGFHALSATVIFLIAFALFSFVGFLKIVSSVPLPVMLALSLGGVAAYLFYSLLRHPTLLGAQIMDQIDGFEMFLVTAEKDRFEALNPPNVTPAVFEKFLPYAIALDCENQWSRKFEAEAAAAGLTPSAGGSYYTPGWYSGNAFNNLGTAGFADAIGTSMASAVSSASSAPGSDGGGSSGGGGGGGGGGGW